MTETTATTVSASVGSTETIDESEIAKLKRNFGGTIVRQGDPDYDEAREIWNAMIDKRPALIARCRDAQDVAMAVNFAGENDLLVAIRGGGHNIAGNAICDGGLVIDLSGMKTVKVDPDARRAQVQPGVNLGELDKATFAHGLGTPVGINSTTGVAGLTLGGGFGWLSRKYGMTVDNLESVDVVTVNGKNIRASESENPDLFWAIRGGGGNFGVVTNFEFRLHPIGPNLLSGLIVFPFEEAGSILRKYRAYYEQMPEELSVWAVLRQAPPLPFLPPEVHGKEILALALCYVGDPADGERLVDELRGFGHPVGEHVGVQPFTDWQQAFDPLLTPGARNYWKSHNFSELSDAVLDTMTDYAGTLPSPQCEIFVAAIGGATSRVASDATAYPHRDARFVMNVHGRWDAAEDDERCISWAREFFRAAESYATGGVYVNFMTEDESSRVSAAYGPNFEKLAALKAKYDPSNFFRLNQNVAPR